MNAFLQFLLVPVALIGQATLGSSAWGESTTGLPKSLVTYERPVFPADLKASAITEGYASVVLLIDADGRIVDAVVLEASHSAFGESVLNALPTWRFTSKNSDDSFVRREFLRFEFAAKGVVTSISHRDANKAIFPLKAQERIPIRTMAWWDMGTPPTRLSAPAPKLSSTMTTGDSGKVQVSYIIDASGRVRVPFIVNATTPELGRVTLDAIKQWQFSPPMQDGVPVLVEDARSFTFGKH